jgi:hypothetical protein
MFFYSSFKVNLIVENYLCGGKKYVGLYIIGSKILFIVRIIVKISKVNSNF